MSFIGRPAPLVLSECVEQPHHNQPDDSIRRPSHFVGLEEPDGSRYAAPIEPYSVLAVTCAGIADARGTRLASDSLLTQTTGSRARRILAVGTLDEVRAHPAWPVARHVRLPGGVVAPALVNAHAHLDLTRIGPKPMTDGGFAAWIDMVRRGRAMDEAAIAASVQQGVRLLRRGGTVGVGDIAGSVGGAPSLAPARVLDEHGFAGVSYLEFFGLSEDGSPGLDVAQERMRTFEPRSIRLGLEPHAPYTVSVGGYERARAAGLPLCTHLAESRAERDLIASGAGPIRDMLDGLGLWTEAVAGRFGSGQSPVQHTADLLDGVLAVHLNDLSDPDIEMLAGLGVRVAYCPRASAYFGAPDEFGPHRYRELLDAGLPVALGTDSVVNLSQDDVDGRGICVLDEARLLANRDGTDPARLLQMLYLHGPSVLGLDPGAYRIEPECDVAGLIAVQAGHPDAARGLIESTGPIVFL